MAPKTVTIAGQDYTLDELKSKLAPVLAGDAKALKARLGDFHEFNMAMLAASLRAGGVQASDDDVKGMHYFAVYIPLEKATMEVNGLTAEGESEAAPAPAAADSTSDSSTQQ